MNIYIYILYSATRKLLKSHGSNGHNTYVIMKMMCSPGRHQNGFVATQALVYV